MHDSRPHGAPDTDCTIELATAGGPDWIGFADGTRITAAVRSDMLDIRSGS